MISIFQTIFGLCTDAVMLGVVQDIFGGNSWNSFSSKCLFENTGNNFNNEANADTSDTDSCCVPKAGGINCETVRVISKSKPSENVEKVSLKRFRM